MPIRFPPMLLLFCLCLGQALAGIAGAAATPAAAIEEWVASLKAGKTTPADNPSIALSPFCPEEKRQKYATALEELAGSLKTAVCTVEPAVPPRGPFAGCRLVLMDKGHPLRTRVLPVCVLNAGGIWKVAAGIEHFQNTRSAGGAEDAAMGNAVSKETIGSARQTEQEMRSKSAETLWQRVRALRDSWPSDGSPEDHVRRYHDFRRAGDAIGRLACFHLPSELPPPSLEKFLDLLVGEGTGSGTLPDGEAGGPGAEKIATTYPQTLIVAKHEIEQQVCIAVGLLDASNPGDSSTEPLYLKQGENGRWLLLAEGSGIDGLPGPRDKLTRWFEDNLEDLDKDMVLAFASKGQEMYQAKPGKEGGTAFVGHYLEAIVRSDFQRGLGMLDLPGKDQVESYAGLLSALGIFHERLVVPGAPPAIVLPMGWQQEGDFGGAVHAIFQPAAKRPFFLDLQMVHWNGSAWRVLPPAWDDAPAGLATDPAARKVREALEGRWDAFKTEAVLSLFQDQAPEGESAASADAAGVGAILATAFGHAANGRIREYLGHWEKPAAGDEPVKALEMASRIGREIELAKSAPVIDAVAVRGNLAGAVIPIPGGKREDGQKAGRMLLLRHVADSWRLLPGVEFFRPINRGYKELNAKAMRESGGRFPPPAEGDFKALVDWLENLPPPH